MENTKAPPPDCLPVRQQIITLAQQLEAEGCHYLWGAGGDAPLGVDANGAPKNGVPFGPKDKDGNIVVDKTRGATTKMMAPYKNPVMGLKATVVPDAGQTVAIGAAYCDASGHHYVCSGRYNKPVTPWGPSKGSPAINGSIVKTDQQVGDLKAYLTPLGTDTTTQGNPVNGLTPRTVIGQAGEGVAYELNAFDTNEDFRSKIVWGEECSTRRHFDCVFFVMYCYYFTVPSKRVNWWMSIDQWATNDSVSTAITKNAQGKALNPKVSPDAADLLPADILIKCGRNDDGSTHKPYTHIGMYDGNGGVVQAHQSSTGVITFKYNPNEWKAFRRVPCAILLAT